MLSGQLVGYMRTTLDFDSPAVGEYMILFTPGDTDEKDNQITHTH